MSMLSVEARPQSFEAVAGQGIAKNLLKSICKSPESSPRVLQLYGLYGGGKTTLARIFAMTLNNMTYDELVNSPFLMELDSSQLNKDTITKLIDSWYVSPSGGWRVIIIDENHLLSKQVQSALLKVLEAVPPRTFFVFCTTDIEDVLPTIRSRSLEIKLEPVPYEEMYRNIYEVCERFNIQMDDDVADRIIKVSRGHMRNCHQAITKYELLGRDQYLSLFRSCMDQINNFFIHLLKKDKDACFKDIEQILTFPITTVRDDLEQWQVQTLKALVTEQNEFTKLAGPQATFTICKVLRQDWFLSANSDTEFQACFLMVMSQLLKPQQSAPQQVQSTGARR